MAFCHAMAGLASGQFWDRAGELTRALGGEGRRGAWKPSQPRLIFCRHGAYGGCRGNTRHSGETAIQASLHLEPFTVGVCTHGQQISQDPGA